MPTSVGLRIWGDLVFEAGATALLRPLRRLHCDLERRRSRSDMNFVNCYDNATRADACSKLEFANTYHLAFRDLPEIFRAHVKGTAALDFGCGTGRSTRFLRELGFDPVGVDISEEMIFRARERDPQGDYRLIVKGGVKGSQCGGVKVDQ